MKSPILLLERAWRNAIVYPLLRLVIRNQPITLPLDLHKIRSVLILRYDKIGDMIVTLPILKMLRERNPGLRLDILASEVNEEIVRGCEYVDNVFVVQKNPLLFFRELRRIRKARYEVVLNFIFNRMTSGALISNFLCRKAVKIGLGQEKYRFYFNGLLSIPRGTIHMVEMLVRFVEEVFGFSVAAEEKRMFFRVTQEVVNRVDQFLGKNGLVRRTGSTGTVVKYVVFNVSARQENKRLSVAQSAAIARFLGEDPQMKTVVVFAPEDRFEARQVVTEAKSNRCLLFPEEGSASLAETAWLIEGAYYVITPDTAIVHIASAVGTPVLGIFTPLQVNEEWYPYRVKYALIKAAERKPVRSISPETIINGIRKFNGELSQEVIAREQ